jgi:adenylate kinase family enzyme
MQSFKIFIYEGRNDPSIFHAVFMAGSPGAGKSYVAEQLALPGQLGYKEINSDNEFTRYMKDAFLDLTFNPNQQFQRDVTRAVAKRHTQAKKRHAEVGRLGLVIDGTARNTGKIKAQKKELEKMGYECAMVYVSTSAESAIEADRLRGERGGRSLGPEMITKMHADVEKGITQYKKMFGKLFFEVDNSVWEKTPIITRKLFGILSKWSKTMPKNKIAKQWMKNN